MPSLKQCPSQVFSCNGFSFSFFWTNLATPSVLDRLNGDCDQVSVRGQREVVVVLLLLLAVVVVVNGGQRHWSHQPDRFNK